NVLAAELSDDPTAAKNNGRINGLTRGKTDPAFEQAAFALKNKGDVSEPVLSKFGYHLIKLEDRKPGRPRTFAEAQRQVLKEMREKSVSDAREAAVRDIRTDKRVQFDQATLDALVVTVDSPPIPQNPGPPGAAKRAK